ncbi:MAG: AAA family ATPase [Oscillibacter sp.]|nr:AAA family ATPase [Oscillibacter sp.]
MGTGIIMCGLNGVGKSTLGKALAERLRFHFIDNEDLYFPKTDPRYIYASPRTREEVEMLFLHEIQTHENFVFASVKGDYGEVVYPFFQYAVLIDVPKDIRIRRVRERAFGKFGDRMLPGGDLYEQEENFFRLVSSRAENMVEEWVKSLSCPVIRVDGTKLIEENADLIIERIQHLGGGFCRENGAFGCDLPAE